MTFRTRRGTKQVSGIGHYYEECLLLSARACPSSGAMALSKSQGPCSLRDRVAEVVTGIPDKQESEATADGGKRCEDSKARRHHA